MNRQARKSQRIRNGNNVARAESPSVITIESAGGDQRGHRKAGELGARADESAARSLTPARAAEADPLGSGFLSPQHGPMPGH